MAEILADSEIRRLVSFDRRVPSMVDVRWMPDLYSLMFPESLVSKFLRVENSEPWIPAARRLNAPSLVAAKNQRSSLPMESLAVKPKESAARAVELKTATMMAARSHAPARA